MCTTSRGIAHLLGLLEGIREACRLPVPSPQVARAKRAQIEAPRRHHHIQGVGVLELRPLEARDNVEALARLALSQRQAHGFGVAGNYDLHEAGQAVAPVHRGS